MAKFLKKIVFLLLAVILLFWLYSKIINTHSSGDDFANPSRSERLLDRLFGREPKPDPIIPAAEITVRIPEGWTNDDIATYLAQTGPWLAADVLEADKGKEGYLFPDTYRVYASSTAASVVDKMLKNFDAKLTDELRADITKQGKTVEDIIIMASLIEKEAPINYNKEENEDARIIGGIFWNRLKIGQGLQSDATLSYILKDKEDQHSGADLQIDSLYNTYKYRGLPPGPIANPGLLAIRAAIYPATTKYYYFLTTPDRQVIYAKTYEEHLQNKYKYLK